MCSISLSAFGGVNVPDFGHSIRYAVGVHLLSTEEGQEDTVHAFSDSLDLVFTWTALYKYSRISLCLHSVASGSL